MNKKKVVAVFSILAVGILIINILEHGFIVGSLAFLALAIFYIALMMCLPRFFAWLEK